VAIPQRIMQAVFEFLYGSINHTLSAFFLFSVIAVIVAYFAGKVEEVKQQLKFIGVYNILIIIAHHIDLIMINNLAPAEDTTRILVIILMSGRVLNEIFAYLKAGGISVPKILTLSVEKMEEVDNPKGKEKEWDEEKISRQIEYVSEKIRNFEELEKEIYDKLDLKGGDDKE